MKITLIVDNKSVDGEIDKNINSILLEEVVKVMCQEILLQIKDE